MRFLSRTLIVLAAAVVSLLISREASAQSYFCATGFPPCTPGDAKSQCFVGEKKDPRCGPEECCNCNKSPGYVATGEYVTGAVDLAVPTNGLPLVASRHYSSVHTIDGPTGYGWSSSFHSRLNYTTYLLAAPSTYHKEADVVMPDGSHFRFTQDPATGVFTAPLGRYDTLVQNVDGTFDLTIERSRSKMHFSADGWLLSRSDEYGNTLNYTYDGSGRLQQVADASGTGRYLNVYWNPNGRISAVEDNSGRTVQYGYSAFGMLTSVTNAAGQTTTYTYIAGRIWNLLSQIKDHWGRVITDVTWDGRGRVLSYSENGETFTYTYAVYGGSLTSKRDSAGNTWHYPYGAGGLVTQEQPPSGQGGATGSTTFNADGTIQLSIDPAGVQTYYTYAGQGRVASVTRNYATGASVRFDYTYDPTFLEKVTSILPKNPSSGLNDPNWQGWKYDYYPTGSAPGAALPVG